MRVVGVFFFFFFVVVVVVVLVVVVLVLVVVVHRWQSLKRYLGKNKKKKKFYSCDVLNPPTFILCQTNLSMISNVSVFGTIMKI
jgi:hypothetical protein